MTTNAQTYSTGLKEDRIAAREWISLIWREAVVRD
jgi:hypothetical protein